jgi:hypothetical protein
MREDEDDVPIFPPYVSPGQAFGKCNLRSINAKKLIDFLVKCFGIGPL